MARSIADLCLKENLAYENYYSQTFRAVFTLRGVKKAWDIHHISIPFSPEKEAALKEAFHITDENIEDFYKAFAKCVTNSLRIGQKLSKLTPADIIKEHVLVPEYCSITTDEATRRNDVYWVTDCIQPLTGHPYWNMDNRRNFIIQQAPVIASGMRVLNEHGVSTGAISPENIYIVKNEDGTETIKIGDFLYGSSDKTVEVVPPVTIPKYVPKGVRKGKKPDEYTDAAMMIAFVRNSLKDFDKAEDGDKEGRANSTPPAEWYREKTEDAKKSKYPMREVERVLIDVRDCWGDIPEDDAENNGDEAPREFAEETTPVIEEPEMDTEVPEPTSGKAASDSDNDDNSLPLTKKIGHKFGHAKPEGGSGGHKGNVQIGERIKKLIIPVLLVLAVAAVGTILYLNKGNDAAQLQEEQEKIMVWAGDYTADIDGLKGQVSISTDKDGVYYADVDLTVKGYQYKAIMTVTVDSSNTLVLNHNEYKSGNQVAKYKHGDAVIKMIKTEDSTLYSCFDGTWNSIFHLKGEQVADNQQPAAPQQAAPATQQPAAPADTAKQEPAKPADSTKTETKTSDTKKDTKSDSTKTDSKKTETKSDSQKSTSSDTKKTSSDSSKSTSKTSSTKSTSSSTKKSN